jgi:hypothetical protein
MQKTFYTYMQCRGNIDMYITFNDDMAEIRYFSHNIYIACVIDDNIGGFNNER